MSAFFKVTDALVVFVVHFEELFLQQYVLKALMQKLRRFKHQVTAFRLNVKSWWDVVTCTILVIFIFILIMGPEVLYLYT